MNPHVHLNQLQEHIPSEQVARIAKADIAILRNRTGPDRTHTRLDRLTATTFQVRHGKYRALKKLEPVLP